MSKTDNVECVMCGENNEFPRYGSGTCGKCGQEYEYDEGIYPPLTHESMKAIFEKRASVNNDTTIELKKAAENLYQEGYACGISDDRWFDAWAMALAKIANGAEFTDDLVTECFHEIKNGKGNV